MITCNNRISCLALDFDRTIAHFNVKNKLSSIFIDLGISYKDFQGVYKLTIFQGFTFSLLINNVKRFMTTQFDEKVLLEKCEQWLHESLIAYPDSFKYITKWKNDYPVVIVTRGDKVFQKLKLELLKIPYDDVLVSTKDESKLCSIKELLDKYGPTIIYCDNSLKELEAINQADFSSEQLMTILMNRDNSLKKQGKNYQVTNFEQLDQMLSNK